MAGYIFLLDSIDALQRYTQNGVYATKITLPSGFWRKQHEGTFADYATMSPGDNIYFFIKRMIYGIGKLINLGLDCKFFNYPDAGKPQIFKYPNIKPGLLWDEDSYSVDQRCICVFERDPYFFTNGIDMDDVLSSNPAAFKMLRALWKVSFIKIDDEENQAFRDIILKRNQEALQSPIDGINVFPFTPCHTKIHEHLSPSYHMSLGISAVLESCASKESLQHEMAIEAGILHQLKIKDKHTSQIFGNWDYLSHQVIASPFKPIDYMDKMDLFGYSYVPGFKPTKAKFLVGEIKKDGAQAEDVDQLLKYVDWVKDEYCFGDYSMINAFLIAQSFDQTVINHKQEVGLRKYTVGVRPAHSLEWNTLKLVRYIYNAESCRLNFSLIE
jgi:hypothetical protein